MQLIYKFELRCQSDQLRHSLDCVKILFWLGVDGWVRGATAYLRGATAYLVGGWVGGKIIPRIRLISAKD